MDEANCSPHCCRSFKTYFYPQGKDVYLIFGKIRHKTTNEYYTRINEIIPSICVVLNILIYDKPFQSILVYFAFRASKYPLLINSQLYPKDQMAC